MIDVGERLLIARDLKRSLEEELKDTPGIHIDVEHRGDAVLWSYGQYSGRIPIIGKVDETVILEFPQTIISTNSSGGSSSYHSVSSIRTLISIWDKIENYLNEHGEKRENPCRSPTYTLRRGIPISVS